MHLKFLYYLEIGENCQIKTDETDSTSECSLKCANNATCTQDPENPGKTTFNTLFNFRNTSMFV